MYNIFKDFGDINEVVILLKKDRRGKRYKFVIFFNVEDERMLAVKLDNIIIGKHKIYTNISKFKITKGCVEVGVGRYNNKRGTKTNKGISWKDNGAANEK